METSYIIKKEEFLATWLKFFLLLLLFFVPTCAISEEVTNDKKIRLKVISTKILKKIKAKDTYITVSYTHLTLPTRLSV